MDIMRHQVAVCGDKVQPFLTLIQELFEQMEQVVHDQLDNPEPGAHGLGVSTPGSSQTFQNSPRPGSPVASVSDLGADPQQQTRPLLRGMASFKVLAECPIIVVSIFQVYRQSVSPNVKLFVPLIKSVLLPSREIRSAERTVGGNSTYYQFQLSQNLFEED
jgi:transformation/transcription domain-associated protein